MEKQRSFPRKPTKFLVFSLTISSSLIFLTFLFIWVIKATTPSFHEQNTHLHLGFNNTALSETLTDLNRDLSASELTSSILTDTNYTRAGNISGFRDISVSDAVPSESKITAHDEIREDIGNNTLNGKGTTSFDAKFSAGAVNYSSTTEEPQEKDHKPYQYLRAEVYNGNRQQDASDNTTFSSPDKVHLLSGCDITKGKWVFDETYPLYRNTTCPFIDEGFNCEANGRLDKDYMKWRWQPSDCDIPRFNATKMLELIRGKRMVFVGDSINRNQWESMLCLLMGAIKDPKKVYETRGRKITKEKGNYSFKFVDYKCTVEFYVSHFLVHESKARLGKKRMQTLRIDTVDRGSSRWTGADILVFNTAHWWNHHKTKAGTNYYQEGDQIHPRLQVSVAFERALTTWASWVDKYINPRRTRVFFRSSSPSHFSGGQWNTGGHCKEARQPTNATLGISPVKNRIVEEVLRQMKTPVAFLSITGLSNYRIDGHPSIYGRKSETSNFSGMEDCSHWCLPGVPDSWNDLLYYHLLFNGRNSRNPYF